MIGAFIGGVITGIFICCMALFLWGACSLSANADKCEAIWLAANKRGFVKPADEKEIDLEQAR